VVLYTLDDPFCWPGSPRKAEYDAVYPVVPFGSEWLLGDELKRTESMGAYVRS
jgi:hypothetical protein